MSKPAPEEEVLTGGNVADRVVRIGSTVRKPATRASASVQSLLAYLHVQGFNASPRPFGFDDEGRQILEYIPGTPSAAHSMSCSDLERVGGILRSLHDFSARFPLQGSNAWDVPIVPDQQYLICHNDLAPWNLIQDGDRWVFIDWDGAGPGSRLWDLAYAAITFLPIEPDGDLEKYKLRFRSLLDGYDLASPERRTLCTLMAPRARAMYRLLVESSETGVLPWARLYAEGHGTYWKSAADYLDAHASWLTP